MLERDLALPDATIYRPANLQGLGGRKLGVLIWGNGGCSNDGASAQAHLAEIASHGYLVIAPGKPLSAPGTAPGAPAPQFMKVSISDMRAALDWALAENGRAGSPYYKQIDPSAVAVSGHSCGGMLAILMGQDPRVKAVIIHNSGINSPLPDNPPLVLHRERLQGLHTPVLFVLGGKSDVAWPWGQQAFEDINKVPVFVGSLDVGHGGTFRQPHGGAAAQVATDWLEWRLRGDPQAAHTFEGADCKLCVDPKWTVRKKGMR
jgi:dienelactone hydrolase